MKKHKLFKDIIFFLTIPLILFSVLGLTQAFGQNKSLNFEYNGQTMAEVAGEISRQLNYKVLMADELTQKKISGKFHNVTLNDFLARIFKDTNIILLYDEIDNQVTISSFGKKNHMIEYDQTGIYTGAKSNSDPLEAEVQPGIKLSEVVFEGNDLDPSDHEVEPGVKIRDVVFHEDNLAPTDHEIEPGIKIPTISPDERNMQEAEIEPGIDLPEIVAAVSDDQQEVEIEPGVKLRNAIFN